MTLQVLGISHFRPEKVGSKMEEESRSLVPWLHIQPSLYKSTLVFHISSKYSIG